MEFRTFLDQSDAKWLAILSESEDWSDPGAPFVAIQPNTPRKFCSVAVLRAPCHVDGKRYSGVIMIWLFRPANELLASLPNSSFKKLTILSTRWDVSCVDVIVRPTGKTLAIDSRPKVFFTTQEQLVAILCSNSIPKITKVLTTLLHMYPYVLEEVKIHTLVAGYEHALDVYGDGLMPYNEPDAGAADSKYRVATICYLLISSYSQDGKLGEQLHK